MAAVAASNTAVQRALCAEGGVRGRSGCERIVFGIVEMVDVIVRAKIETHWVKEGKLGSERGLRSPK